MPARTPSAPHLASNASRHRVFLFLQGPHGPFFQHLASGLRRTGARVLRVGFNAGDHAFWPDKQSYVAYRDAQQDWPETIATLLDRECVTDLVVYNDTRPIHAVALRAAALRGITRHVFEEGYLRPYWITYERDGSNGHSRLMDLCIDQMRAALKQTAPGPPRPPAHWGNMRRHMAYGAIYHGLVLLGHGSYPLFSPHRSLPVSQEFRLHLSRLLLQPLHAVQRRIATYRIRRGLFPYHLALLQLEHDSSFRVHSPFASMLDFVETVIVGFANGAPRHHHLVFKTHPLEDGRVPLRATIRRLADKNGLAGRVHIVGGGKLARLLDDARSVITVNSTAGQQALWRGLATRTFGSAVYNKAELVSYQPLTEFFANPAPPDTAAYADYRRFLLATSQVPGGYYASGGRRALLRRIPDLMLSRCDPYDALLNQTEAAAQHLRLIQ